MAKRALVVVLGDLARSPRMQYHCMSLAENGFEVTVIANGGGPAGDRACEKLESSKNVRQKLMTDTVDFKKFLPTALAYLIKPIWQTLLLAVQLFIAPLPHVIIVQNPPSIPAMPVMYFYKVMVRAKLIIDWHNYGFTILSLNLGRDSAFVRVMKFIELFFGRLADAGFCVSKAMQHDLIENFHMTYPIHVLYDKPPSHFKPLSLRRKHEFFNRIQGDIPEFQYDGASAGDNGTRFTSVDEPIGNVISRPNRPAIILSSTSWTEDEDFDLLLTALKNYDEALDSDTLDDSITGLPDLVCVITGKGPLKAHYEHEIKNLALKHIKIVLPWLSAEDYAKMVGSCDLGICLHSSSSGLDLPMKVIDLFGCGIPVLALKYKAINELVIEDEYGLTFQDSHDLFIKLTELLKHFHRSDEQATDQTDLRPIERYKKNIIRHFLKYRWEANWKEVAMPVFDLLTSIKRRE